MGAATRPRRAVIAYDRRESGLSEGRIEPLDWNVYSHEAKGLLDHLGVKQSYILGGCMGASLALRMGVLFPERCKGLLMHWPVGGYQWMMRAHGFFQRHFDFVAANGLEGVAARAKGAHPYVQLQRARVSRELALGAEVAQYEAHAEVELARMQKMDAYIALRGVHPHKARVLAMHGKKRAKRK